MDKKRDLTSIFAYCFRLLAQISAGVKDGFFSGIINLKSDELFADYVKFLETRWGMLPKFNNLKVSQGGRTAPESHIAATSALIFQIQSIFELLEIIKYLKLTDSATPLLLQKNLLLIKSAVFQKTEFPVNLTENSELKSVAKEPEPKSPSVSVELTPVHHQIRQFIENQEQIQNLEIFAKFTQISRRTLKRKLSELLQAGAIKRFTLGRKVFYAPLPSRNREHEKFVDKSFDGR